jgi:hypothetical protein
MSKKFHFKNVSNFYQQIPSLFGPLEGSQEKVVTFTTCDSFKVLADLVLPAEEIQVAHEIVSQYKLG